MDCKAHDLIFIMESRSMLPAALDEIERQAKEIDSWIADRDSWIARYQEWAKRIAELEASLAEAEEFRKNSVGHFDLIANQRDEAERKVADLESRLKLLQGHNYVNATPDGSYSLHILQSYRAMCDVSWSDAIDAPPTSPLCIEMNKVDDARKKELDAAIGLLSKGGSV